MEILGSNHVIAYSVVTHPYIPRSLRNMGSNNTQMNIIEATPGVWVGDYCAVNSVITPEDSNVGPYICTIKCKMAENRGPPIF